jgi:predicted TIM-barrel fold metal-dependent hydrolase
MVDLVVDLHLHANSKKMIKPLVWEWMSTFIEKGNLIGEVLNEKGEMEPAKLADLLKKSGVDYGVCLAEYSPLAVGIVPNEYVSEFCRDYPSLIPFANINPYISTKPEEDLKYCLDELGMQGLKMLPSYQHFYPHERRLYPLYELAQKRGIIVMSHTGSSVFPGTKIRYADPLYWDDVARDFPELKIVLVHSGRGFWYDKAAFLAQLHSNVYIEIAGLPPHNLLKYIPDLDKISHKVIFGSDWPGVPSIEGNIKAIRELPISAQSKRNILGLNAASLLGLKGKPQP